MPARCRSACARYIAYRCSQRAHLTPPHPTPPLSDVDDELSKLKASLGSGKPKGEVRKSGWYGVGRHGLRQQERHVSCACM